MPCMDGGPIRDDAMLRRRADQNARIACDALSLIKREMPEQILRLSPETQAWWAAHQEADRIREQREKEARERQALKDSAYAKLTPAERKALNL